MILEIAVIAATVAIAAGARGAERHRRRLAMRTFDQYARSRSILYVPSPAEPRGAGPRMEGDRDGVPFAFDLYRLGSDLRTRVTATVAKGVAPRITILQRGVFSRTLASDAGSEALDRAYAVSGATPEDHTRLVETVWPALLTLDGRDSVSIVSSGEKVTLSWSGVERDPLVYDAARDAVVAIAGWHRPDTPYR